MIARFSTCQHCGLGAHPDDRTWSGELCDTCQAALDRLRATVSAETADTLRRARSLPWRAPGAEIQVSR